MARNDAAVVEAELVEGEAQRLPTSALESITRGEVDIQITTANRFPRSIASFQKRATELACLNEQMAEQCLYALPRGGKTIEGPSARFAEIIASTYKHMRVAGRVTDIDEKFITATGVAWDLENNVATAVEVRRRITDKDGNRYNDDMITVTSNAAISIATRNATLKDIPQAVWFPIYMAARAMAAGDVKSLEKRRDELLKHFLVLGVQNATVFKALGVDGAADITLDHLVTMKAVATAIKSGELTVEGAFSDLDKAEQLGAAVVTAGAWLEECAKEEQDAVNKAIKATKLTLAQRAALFKKFEGKPKELLEAIQKGATAQPEKKAEEKPAEPAKQPEKKQPAKPAGDPDVESL